MKTKILNFFTVIMISVFIFSCGNGDKQKDDEKRNRIRVISTITIIDDIAKQIGKDKIENFVICETGKIL